MQLRESLLVHLHQVIVVVALFEGRYYQAAVAAAEVEEDVAMCEAEEVEGFGLGGGVGGAEGRQSIFVVVGSHCCCCCFSFWVIAAVAGLHYFGGW